jgi:hypothetical protein
MGKKIGHLQDVDRKKLLKNTYQKKQNL